MITIKFNVHILTCQHPIGSKVYQILRLCLVKMRFVIIYSLLISHSYTPSYSLSFHTSPIRPSIKHCPFRQNKQKDIDLLFFLFFWVRSDQALIAMPEKVTQMVLKVDLQCHRCYKKVKRILCQIPEVQDQIYDEKQNLVKIKVVSCCPEKIMQKICCKGGRSITSIEIVVPKKPDKPKEPEKPKDPPPKPKDPPPKPKEPEKPKDPPPKPKEPEKPKEPVKPKDPPPPKPPVPNPPVPGCPPVFLYPMPMGTCCGPCSQGQGGGPCFHGHGCPPPQCGQPRPYGPPPPCYGKPVYDSYGGGYRGCNASRCDYFSEENPTGCTIM